VNKMKGITPIIATIILLLVTIGLASAAYTYMSTFFTQMTAGIIEIVDSYCLSGNGNQPSTANVILRNSGTAKINVNCPGTSQGQTIDCDGITIVKTSGGNIANPKFTSSSGESIREISPGGIAIFTETGCSGHCSYRFVPKAGAKAVTTSVYCP